VQTRSDGVVEPWRGELRRGLERLRDGEFADAEAHFARAHRMAPDRAEVCFALGRERLRRGDFDQAEVLLRQAWQLDPSLVSAAAFLARCLGVDTPRSKGRRVTYNIVTGVPRNRQEELELEWFRERHGFKGPSNHEPDR